MQAGQADRPPGEVDLHMHSTASDGSLAPSAVVDAARMAERSYARLSRLLQHQFREKKPIIVFASRGDFAQSNVFGDLGEGTGGITDLLRQRMAQPFTGDYRSFETVCGACLLN